MLPGIFTFAMNENETLPAVTESVGNENDKQRKISLVNRYVQSLCGLYSRIARQLKVDRSYVSRVARGERRSALVETAIVNEFERVIAEEKG